MHSSVVSLGFVILLVFFIQTVSSNGPPPTVISNFSPPKPAPTGKNASQNTNPSTHPLTVNQQNNGTNNTNPDNGSSYLIVSSFISILLPIGVVILKG